MLARNAEQYYRSMFRGHVSLSVESALQGDDAGIGTGPGTGLRRPISIRFDQDVRTALEKAAKEDRRPIFHLVQKVIANWLKAGGFLK